MTHALQIIPIPAFEDNYIWLLHNGEDAIAIDPGDAAPVIETLHQLDLSLKTILITHHHHDHIGGVARLIQQFSQVAVYSPTLTSADFSYQSLQEHQALDITLSASSLSHRHNLIFKVIAVPGHTLDHIAYQLNINDEVWLFCGDTLFGAGCGRLFEGSPAQMLASLKKLTDLPAYTKVFCTHEYTLKNIAFALTLEPDNADLLQRHQETKLLSASHIPSLPSTIGLELATNPFLRAKCASIKSSLNLPQATELEIFTKMRALRNVY